MMNTPIKDGVILDYPNIRSNTYIITTKGNIYSLLESNFISWSTKNRIPYVNLICESNDRFILETFYIKDLVAYSFTNDAKDYLERGYHAVNIDGDPMNCSIDNIIYINPNKDL